MTNQFLEEMSHTEKLEAIVHERAMELLMYKAFLRDKGLEALLRKALYKSQELK